MMKYYEGLMLCQNVNFERKKYWGCRGDEEPVSKAIGPSDHLRNLNC
jgi:hypothetical protein